MEIAIIKTGGKQYLISPGQKIKIEKLETKQGDEYIFDEVLLHNKGSDLKIGAPLVKKLRVVARILDTKKNKKIIVFKYKPKKRYKVKGGHRQTYTEVEIIDIKEL